MAANLNRQQICAELGISESTIRRLEILGLPYTPVGLRAKRYDLAECKKWLRENQCQCDFFAFYTRITHTYLPSHGPR